MTERGLDLHECAVVPDGRDDWSEHRPSTAAQNGFVAEPGFAVYAKSHLGVDETKKRETKARYRFPHGDFTKVHRCARLAAESRAGQYGTPRSSSPSPTCTGSSRGRRPTRPTGNGKER